MDRAIREFLQGISDPAYSVDEQGRVSGWNDAARRLLGYRQGEVLDRPCHEILRGRDVFGNPYCGSQCPVVLMARRCEAVRHFQMDVHSKDGVPLRVSCSVLATRRDRPDAFSLVHVLNPADRLAPSRDAPAEASPTRLTVRELEVLGLLAEASSTREMAGRMNVSISTVRKHVANVLQKLGARSRLEAVMTAMEKGIPVGRSK